MSKEQITVFAVDCGATNWRLFRSTYVIENGRANILSIPQCSPLTSFSNRQLPAALFMDIDQELVESYGETALSLLDDEEKRNRVRYFFKPSIGNYLLSDPEPHQVHYSHQQAMKYTRLLLAKLIEQIRKEKWRSSQFNQNARFMITYPVHWAFENNGEILGEFKSIVSHAFSENNEDYITFISEPEGAVLALLELGVLKEVNTEKVTLLIDVGGSTTDIVAGKINMRTGGLDFLGRYGEPFGGGLYDFEIASYIADELNLPDQSIVDEPSVLISLSLHARRLKESISQQILQESSNSAIANRTCTMVLANGQIHRGTIQLTDKKFNEITHGLQMQFQSLVSNALNVLNLSREDIGQVVLVGGGAKLYTLISYLREFFGNEKVLLADNPGELVALGAGYQFGRDFDDIPPSIVFSVEDITGEKVSEREPEKYSLQQQGGEEFLLRNSKNTLGRANSNDIVLDDQKSSRFHAEITIQGCDVYMMDLNSTNGTYIDGKRLTPGEAYFLSPQNHILIGDTEFQLREKNDKGSD